MDPEIKPNSVYVTNETKEILRMSNSTIKRLLKKDIIKTNKVEGQCRGEILRLVLPKTKRMTVSIYQKIEKKLKIKLRNGNLKSHEFKK